ncbi:MAG TPA: ABC transporter substrate-binding protein [Methylomirabilota bacterium]|nr:ABC transporter substrate-binding protein [Methylomirabilota bacterium]
MRRAGVIGLIGLLLASLVATVVTAQAPKPHRIGLLTATANPDREAVLRQELRRLGYTEGQNLVIEYRTADARFERLPALAEELVGLKVDVIIAVVTQASLAAKKATSTTPVVMVAVDDPVRAGLVTSLARPGGNVTGTSTSASEVVGKQLELLRELRPKASRIGLLWNPANPVYQKRSMDAAKAAAAKLKIRLQIAAARAPEDFDRALTTIAGQGAEALLILADPLFTPHGGQLAELTVKHRLPAVSGPREMAEQGLLMTYGPSFAEAYRRTAFYVDRILKGARPADLPVEQGSKFDLVVNAKSARALGVPLPNALVTRADHLVQ